VGNLNNSDNQIRHRHAQHDALKQASAVAVLNVSAGTARRQTELTAQSICQHV
jgi:hypothetical protein